MGDLVLCLATKCSLYDLQLICYLLIMLHRQTSSIIVECRKPVSKVISKWVFFNVNLVNMQKKFTKQGVKTHLFVINIYFVIKFNISMYKTKTAIPC